VVSAKFLQAASKFESKAESLVEHFKELYLGWLKTKPLSPQICQGQSLTYFAPPSVTNKKFDEIDNLKENY
jgi:hypothetical protein